METNNTTKYTVKRGKKLNFLSAEKISKSYSEKILFNDISIGIDEGESYNFLRDDRVGIIGVNGSGKSTLLNIIEVKLEVDNGFISTGSTVKTGCFSQENEKMNEELRVIDYIREVAEFITTNDGTVSASRMLERFLFPPSVQWTPISKLSGGEKRRLFLLRVLIDSPNILLLDEPTIFRKY